jgi:uncharacterized membrane protein YdjX (TVP38/TMEM64 family)
MNMKRIILVLFIIFILIGQVFFAEVLNISILKEHYSKLTNLLNTHYIYFVISFLFIYTLTVALSLPIASFLSLAAGMLFPQPWCTLYIVSSATLGAILLFEWVKFLFDPKSRQQNPERFSKIQNTIYPYWQTLKVGFQKNETLYLLMLRLLPVFPFWLANIAPVFFNVRFSTYVWTTLIGIIPGAFLLTKAGRGIHEGLTIEGEAQLHHFFTTDMQVGIIGILIIILVGIIFKKRSKQAEKMND